MLANIAGLNTRYNIIVGFFCVCAIILLLNSAFNLDNGRESYTSKKSSANNDKSYYYYSDDDKSYDDSSYDYSDDSYYYDSSDDSSYYYSSDESYGYNYDYDYLKDQVDYMDEYGEKVKPIAPTTDDVNKVYDFYDTLSSAEKKVYSDNDGVIQKLIEIAGKKFDSLSKSGGIYVDLDVANVSTAASRNLREKFNWTGLATVSDGKQQNLKLNIRQEMVTFSSVLDQLKSYNITRIDLLSLEPAYFDYYVLSEVLSKYYPKIVAHAVNTQPSSACVAVQKEEAKSLVWDGQSDYRGASVCAFWCLANQLSYTMVYCESLGGECFWLRNDLIDEALYLQPEVVQTILNPRFLYKKPKMMPTKKANKEWVDVGC